MSPRDTVDNILSQAQIVHTPCGDGDIVWQAWGETTTRPPLVLLHGGFGSWTHWIANVLPLSKDRLVLTCDMPGLGDSAVSPGDVAPDNIARPIFDGLDHVVEEGQSFDLAGFSFGGLIGARVAAMAGERCRKYVAVGASGFENHHVRVLGIRVPLKDMSDDRKNEIHRENLRILMLHNEDSIDELAVYTHRKNIARSRVRSRPMSLGDHLVTALPCITAKISGIWGVHDATAGGRDEIMVRQDIFRKHQTDAGIAIIEDAGHWVMYEKSDEFNALLVKMLDD